MPRFNLADLTAGTETSVKFFTKMKSINRLTIFCLGMLFAGCIDHQRTDYFKGLFGIADPEISCECIAGLGSVGFSSEQYSMSEESFKDFVFVLSGFNLSRNSKSLEELDMAEWSSTPVQDSVITKLGQDIASNLSGKDCIPDANEFLERLASHGSLYAVYKHTPNLEKFSFFLFDIESLKLYIVQQTW